MTEVAGSCPSLRRPRRPTRAPGTRNRTPLCLRSLAHRGPLLAVISLLGWLGPFGTIYAEPGNHELNTAITQLEQGELPAAKSTLQSLRRERFPGRSFSGTTCQREPKFALMVAAERRLASKDRVIAGNYLQQLRCLQLVHEAGPAKKRSLKFLRDFRDLIPEKVNECPFPLGAPALERSTQALENGRFTEARDALLAAACLSGQEDPEFIEAHRRLQAAVREHKGGRETAGITPVPKPEPEPDRRPLARPVLPIPQPVEVTPAGGLENHIAPEPVIEDGGASLGDLISRQTSPGEISFNPPESMRTGQAEVIEVRIQPDRVSTEGMLGGGDIQVESIGVTSSMSVKLCCGPPAGDFAFDITALGNEQQVVAPGSFTQWVFEVTPRKEGPQELTLSVSAQYRLNGEVIPKDYPIMTRKIQVVVSGRGSLWLWLSLGAAFVVLSAFWLWTRRRSTPARIFVSYRRDDSGGWVQGLHDRLAEHFGDDVVFMDLNDIAPGSDFVATLNRSLKETSVVLVVIGKRWVEIRDSNDQRRLDDPADWVRLEVQRAISSDKRVIPVLVDGAEMPDAGDLPEDIRALGRYQAVRLYPDQFSSGMQMLIQAIERDATG